MVIAALPSVLADGNAFGPFLLSVYVLAIGAGMLYLLDIGFHN
jgi:hypothetical protein